MKLTNSQLYQGREAFQRLLGEKFPVLTSYALAKLAFEVNERLKVLEVVRNGLVEKWGTPEGSGFRVKEDSPNWKQWIEEIETLMSEEVEVKTGKVRIGFNVKAACPSCGKVIDMPFWIEPREIMALEPFIDMDGLG